MRKDYTFFQPVRVRYNETDPQGIVYNGHYLVYLDIALGEFIRQKGCAYKALAQESGVEICNVKTVIEYHGSAGEDDLLEIGVRVLNVGNKSFTIGFAIYLHGEENTLVEAVCIYSGYDSRIRRARSLPPRWRSILES